MKSKFSMLSFQRFQFHFTCIKIQKRRILYYNMKEKIRIYNGFVRSCATDLFSYQRCKRNHIKPAWFSKSFCGLKLKCRQEVENEAEVTWNKCFIIHALWHLVSYTFILDSYLYSRESPHQTVSRALTLQKEPCSSWKIHEGKEQKDEGRFGPNLL